MRCLPRRDRAEQVGRHDGIVQDHRWPRDAGRCLDGRGGHGALQRPLVLPGPRYLPEVAVPVRRDRRVGMTGLAKQLAVLLGQNADGRLRAQLTDPANDVEQAGHVPEALVVPRIGQDADDAAHDGSPAMAAYSRRMPSASDTRGA